MNPFTWLQSLVTFRKPGGGFQVPELDGNGRIRVSLLTESPVFVGATPPPVIDGGVLWHDTSSSTLFMYDLSRAKWLSVDEAGVSAGRNGATAAGAFYRGIDGMVLDAVNRGMPVPKATLTSLALVRGDATPATLEVLVSGAVVAELATAAAGLTLNPAVNADFGPGVMSFRNKSTGSTTNNVQITARYRRRP
jgi:hypothetical protein